MSENKVTDPIRLGSGKVFAVEETNEINLTSATSTKELINFIKTHAVDENRLGLVKSGASISITETTYTEEDDLGEDSKTSMTAEKISMKLGLITFGGNMLSKILATAEVEKDPDTGISVTRIGGIQNDKKKKHYVIFYHEDVEDGDVVVIIKGNNVATITADFVNGKGAQSTPEFNAEPFDRGGRKLFYVEGAPGTSILAATEEAVAVNTDSENPADAEEEGNA